MSLNSNSDANAQGTDAYDDTGVLAFEFHDSMLADSRRVAKFHAAVVRTVNAGDVVLDVGTGTGILALFAASAGARRVYAVEAGPVVEVARSVFAANELGSRITLIEGQSNEIDIPERASVLITETIGNAGFDEGIAAWVADARDRLLVSDAAIIPRRVGLLAALVEVPRDYARIDRWNHELFRLDLTALARVGIHNIQPTDLSVLNLVTEAQPVVEVDLSTRFGELNGSATTVPLRAATVHAIGVWFDAELCEGIHVSNRPPSAFPSWQQAILPLPEPFVVDAGEPVPLQIEIGRAGADWTWRAGPGEAGSTVYGRTGTKIV